ncbi:MAG: hypothetical protein QM791_00485 [Ferruginibacter sp.]
MIQCTIAGFSIAKHLSNVGLRAITFIKIAVATPLINGPHGMSSFPFKSSKAIGQLAPVRISICKTVVCCYFTKQKSKSVHKIVG